MPRKPRKDVPSCVVCGKRMQAMFSRFEATYTDEKGKEVTTLVRSAEPIGWGYNGNGVLCSQTCGYELGLKLYESEKVEPKALASVLRSLKKKLAPQD